MNTHEYNDEWIAYPEIETDSSNFIHEEIFGYPCYYYYNHYRVISPFILIEEAPFFELPGNEQGFE